MSAEAWITLATNDTYAIGALVLATSLRYAQTSKQISIMITPDISNSMRSVLNSVFDKVIDVNVLDSKDAAHLALMSRPELGVTFTKIHCWSRIEYCKAVFLDADTLVVKNCDELFDNNELSAVTDVGWPDIFNSGVFVFRPSTATFNALLQLAISEGSFDGGDQGLLNQFFAKKWHRLSFIYNMIASIAYTYIPAFKHYGQHTKIVHFLGARQKPWDADVDEHNSEDCMPRNVGNTPGGEYLLLWWTLFVDHILPRLHTGGDFKGFAGRFAVVAAKFAKNKTPGKFGALSRQPRPDGFDVIQRKITESIRKGAQRMKDAVNAKQNVQLPPTAPQQSEPKKGLLKKSQSKSKTQLQQAPPAAHDLPQNTDGTLVKTAAELKKRRKWCCG